MTISQLSSTDYAEMANDLSLKKISASSAPSSSRSVRCGPGLHGVVKYTGKDEPPDAVVCTRCGEIFSRIVEIKLPFRIEIVDGLQEK
jgi:hypothetical protein